MCIHYSEYGPSGPRGEPYDTPGGWECAKEHHTCSCRGCDDICEVCKDEHPDDPELWHHDCSENCPGYVYAPRKEDYY